MTKWANVDPNSEEFKKLLKDLNKQLMDSIHRRMTDSFIRGSGHERPSGVFDPDWDQKRSDRYRMGTESTFGTFTEAEFERVYRGRWDSGKQWNDKGEWIGPSSCHGRNHVFAIDSKVCMCGGIDDRPEAGKLRISHYEYPIIIDETLEDDEVRLESRRREEE